MDFLKKRCAVFLVSPIEWSSCILNVILCACMAYFYYGTESYAPLLYSIFFLSYVFVIFIVGEKAIPFMYLLYILGAIQNITFINCTGFFIVLFLVWHFPNQKYFIYGTYLLEIFFVCFRHEKTVWHLLCHIAFCIVFYLFGELTKKQIERNAIKKEKQRIRNEVENQIYEDVKIELKNELLQSIKPMNLTEGEENILKQLADGKMLKEVEGVSKNTKTDYIESAMIKNECKTKAELIAMYAIQKRLPSLFPILFQQN